MPSDALAMAGQAICAATKRLAERVLVSLPGFSRGPTLRHELLHDLVAGA